MKVLITDYGFKDVETERRVLAAAGFELRTTQCKTEEDVAREAAGADALLVQWAPVKGKAVEALDRCKVVVRYGIGYDNLDLAALKSRGITACNVPDYCIDEVADHALSLGIALVRQLPQTHAKVLEGTWKITPPAAVPAFREMTFATAGFGRIARAVLDRARGFRFRLAAYDPFVPEEAFKQAGVRKLSLEELFAQADLISLHSPLTDQTRHMVNAATLSTMKKTAVLVNTARGPLVDTRALADALTRGVIGGAGLDVFETEPLEADHPLRKAPNVLLTSHTAWYSEASVPELQLKAAEEIVRVLRGEKPKNPIN